MKKRDIIIRLAITVVIALLGISMFIGGQAMVAFRTSPDGGYEPLATETLTVLMAFVIWMLEMALGIGGGFIAIFGIYGSCHWIKKLRR